MNGMDARNFFLQREIPYITPFYALEKKSGKEVLDWFKNTDTKLRSYYLPLFNEQKTNLQVFLNAGVAPNIFSPLVANYFQQGMLCDPNSDIDINEFFRVVMDQVSLIVSNELVPQVIAKNDDYNDKIAAKITKEWLESMSYDQDLDFQRIKWEIQKKVFGECFVVPVWNEEMGDLMPESTEFQEEELDLVDPDGREMYDHLGKRKKIRKYLRQGDIDLINPMPFDVMIDPKKQYKDSNWFYYVEYVETDYLRMKYKNIDFKENPQAAKYDELSDRYKGTPNHTKVFNFYHKSHPFLPEGRHIICTEDHELVNKTLEAVSRSLVETGKLPLVRWTDLDVGVGCRGIPILSRNLRGVVGGYNKLTNQIFKNLEAESPKIFAHETAAVDAQRMPTGIVVMEWRGVHKPTIETPSTNTSSIFKFREDLKQNIIELGMQTPIVRGQTPNAQLDSFVALQHFEDQRVQLAAPDIKSHIIGIQHLYRFMIAIAADNYDPDDGRMIKIVGKNNKYSLRFFHPENLTKIYDVKITTTGNLANSKAARTQFMMTLKREFPSMVSDDVFIDVLGLSASEKFQNIVSAAVNSAEAENEDMLNGHAVPPPARFEDLITHWDSHRIPMQGQEFKMAPPEVMELFERHVTATEKLMYEQAVESPTFAARLTQLRQFPMFFTPTPTNEPPPMPMGMEQQLGGVPEQNSAPTEGMEPPPFNPAGEPASPEGMPQENPQLNQLSPV